MTTTTLGFFLCGINPKNIPVHENKTTQKKKYFKTILFDLQQQYTK
jgi:hypothetical protein